MPVDASPGELLTADLSRGGDPYSITVMVAEAARIADRLHRLDAILAGDETSWARLVGGRDGVLEVRVDNALAEARQQATVMRHLIAAVLAQRAQLDDPDADDDLAGL